MFALSTLSPFADCCGTPAQSGERNNQRQKSQTELCGSPSLAGERAGVPINLCGMLQESLIFFERVLASGLELNFGFSRTHTNCELGCRCREHQGHTPTALFSGPAPALVPAKTATSSCTISLAAKDFTPVQDCHSRASLLCTTLPLQTPALRG